ncbi:hypothetical protein KY310_00235 [Candidatus Woesearchaeota archaeon]|nr:hypothetical protein [Candidatus Woesearchaeota archaeon]
MNAEPKLKGKAQIYLMQPNTYGVYTAILAAKTKEELQELADFFSEEVDPNKVKEITGGFCLEQALIEEPSAEFADHDVIAAQLEKDDKIFVIFPSGTADDEEMKKTLKNTWSKFELSQLVFLAMKYLAECKEDHVTTKLPSTTYSDCIPKEFLDIFDELHESLVVSNPDEGLTITTDLMKLCQGAPFANTMLPSMCGIANNGHPRRDELLKLYRNLVHCVVEEKYEQAAKIREQISQAVRFDYHLGRYVRKVKDNTFSLPKEIAADICRNLDALQYLELRGNGIIMRTKTKEEEKEDYYHEADQAVLVEAPEKSTTIVEIPPEMAKKAGIKNKIEIYSLKDRIEIYAID